MTLFQDFFSPLANKNSRLDRLRYLREGFGSPPACAVYLLANYVAADPADIVSKYSSWPLRRLFKLLTEEVAKATQLSDCVLHQVFLPLKENLLKKARDLEAPPGLAGPPERLSQVTVGTTTLADYWPASDEGSVAAEWIRRFGKHLAQAELADPDTESFSQLYRKHEETVRKIVQAKIHYPKSEVDDVTQTVWLALWLTFDAARPFPLKSIRKCAYDVISRFFKRRRKQIEKEISLDANPHLDQADGSTLTELIAQSVLEDYTKKMNRVFQNRAPLHARLVFLASKALDRTQGELCEQWADKTLLRITVELETDFLADTALPTELIMGCFDPLYHQLGLKLRETIRNRRQLKTYAKLRQRILKTTRLQEYFKSHTHLEQSQEIGHWIDQVRKAL
jgi:hypothetical protein